MKRILLVAMLLAGAVLRPAGEAGATPRMDVPPPTPETPEEKEARRARAAADSVVWLPRLVGRFKYTGVVEFFQTLKPGARAQKEFPPDKTYADGTCDETCQADFPNLANAEGKGDCIAIGKGPGVQCMIHVVWNEEWGTYGSAVEGGVSFLGPASILYGLEPNTASIRYLLLNTNGIAEAESGVLNGDTLRWTFDTHCESSTMDRCRETTRVRAPPGSDRTQMSIDIEKWDSSTGSWQRLTTFTLDTRPLPPEPAGGTTKTPATKAPAAKSPSATAPPATVPSTRRKH